MIRSQEVIESKDQALFILSVICCAICVLHLFYNNLLINLRFYSKMKCVTCGLCLFDCINWAFCYCILLKPCRDRCFTIWTAVKWVFLAAIMGTTIYLVQDYETRFLERFQVGERVIDKGETNLDTYLIIFLLQHPIFMLSRIPIFILYALLTCCCNKGREYPDDEQFKHTILHFDFVNYELG